MARSNHPMYQGDNDRSDDGSYHSMEQQQFEARRDAQMAEQDAVLDQLHHGVKGLKNNAHAINGEVVEQNAMIDDVSNVRTAGKTTAQDESESTDECYVFV